MCIKHWNKVLFFILVLYTNSLSLRNERLFFPIIPFYRITTVTPTLCVGIGPEFLEGTCNTLSRCRNAGLTSASPCEGNLGYCCVDIKYCGGVSSSPVVYFRNPATVSESCDLIVRKTNSSICQLRLDFINFSLTQPTRGTCNDFLQLSLGESYLPKICGDNTGQHVYVDFLPNCDDQTLSFKFLNPSTANKQWNIKVTQIPCNSPLAAPRGCLQYYTSLMGTVSSFNYGLQATNVLRQLSPLNYTVCVSPQYGYCSISWSNTTATSFRLQNATMVDMVPTVCESNYISFLNPECTPFQCPARNRFCGVSFTGVTSSARIFELQVVNNYQDTQTDGDMGFSLNYQQRICN